MANTLSKERRGEIAEILVKQFLFDKGINLRPEETKREFGNLAKKTGIPKKELNLFFRPIAEEALKKVFSEDETSTFLQS